MSSQERSPTVGGGRVEGVSGSSEAKTARKQGVSCDACKFRKVRCDRRAKLEAKAPNQHPNEVACTVCAQHGLRCTFTQSAPRRRRGKRIVAIQRSQLEDLDDSSAGRSVDADQQQWQDDDDDAGADAIAAAAAAVDGARSSAQQKTRQSSEPLFGFDHEQRNDVGPALHSTAQIVDQIRSRSNVASNASRPASLTMHQSLFGVRGLTRALLDACVRAYFKYASPCQPILHVEIFSARYALFFVLFEESNGVVPTVASSSSAAGPENTPLSLALILAVGSVGAALLEPPIAAAGSQAKFRLQDRMALRFQQEMHEKDMVTRLKEEGSDVLEACYVMSDSPLKVLGNDEKDKALDWEHVSRAPVASRSMLDPLKMNPSTAEAVVKLLFALGLNKRPKPRTNRSPGDPHTWTSGGVAITESEVFRRTRIFWSAFMQDSFRSLSSRKNVAIGDDDYDLDLPRIVPRPDGLYSTEFFYSDRPESSTKVDALKDYTPTNPRRAHDDIGPDPNPSIMHLQPSRSARFDALQLEVMLRLAFVVRTVSIRFVSPRAQGRGVLITDVERATSSLTAWWKQLPKDVTWDVQIDPLLRSMREGKVGSNNAIALRNSIKAAFVEVLYHGNVLAVWASVADYGIRFEVDLTEAVHLFATRLGLEEQTDFRVKDSVAKTMGQEGQADERKRQARAGMDRLAAFSLCRIARLAKEAGLIGIMRANRSVLLNVCSSYAVWGCDLGRRIAQTGSTFGMDAPHGHHPAEFALACVDEILFGLRTVDSFEAVSGILRQITDLLQKSRDTVRDLIGSSVIYVTHNTTVDNEGAAASFGAYNHAAAVLASESSLLNDAGKHRHMLTPPLTQQLPQQLPLNASEQPFHYFSAFRETTQASQNSFYSSPTSTHSSMENDEVSLLARAALPDKDSHSTLYNTSPAVSSNATGVSSSLSPPDNAHNNSSRPQPSHTTSFVGAGAADHTMDAIAGLDTTWLQDYLGLNADGVAGQSRQLSNSAEGDASIQSASSVGLATTAPVASYPVLPPASYYAASAHTNATDGAPPAPAPSVFGPGPATATPSVSPHVMPTVTQHHQATQFGSVSLDFPATGQQHQGQASSTMHHDERQAQHPYLTHGQAASQADGLGMQWEQLMVSAGDAQIWAQSQWQGFHFAQ